MGGLIGDPVRRRDFLVGLAGVAATARRPVAAAAAPRFMYIGSFTGKDAGHGDGLSVYARGGESERWTLRQQLKELADPSFLITHRVRLDDAPEMYRTFRDKEDECIKVVMRP